MSMLSKSLKKAEHWIGSKIPHTKESEKRAAMQATKEQINYYKEAKEDLTKTRNENEEQKKMERQRINEKEIRSRQRMYRRGGFLETPANEPKETLG